MIQFFRAISNLTLSRVPSFELLYLWIIPRYVIHTQEDRYHSNNKAASMVPFTNTYNTTRHDISVQNSRLHPPLLIRRMRQPGERSGNWHTQNGRAPKISRPWLFFRLRGKIFMYRNPAQKSYCSGPGTTSTSKRVLVRAFRVCIYRSCRLVEKSPSESAAFLPSRSEEWTCPGIRASALGVCDAMAIAVARR